jgi:microcin C transport system substrate-binding protein
MPPGSGPYILLKDNFVSQKRFSLTRRTNWWGADEPDNEGLYNFDRLTFLVVTDERLRLEKFKSGEHDFYSVGRAQWWEDEFDYPLIKRGIQQKRKVYNDYPIGISGFVFNMREKPFDDVRVREAIAYLFNRQKLVDDLMYSAYTMTDSYYPNSVYENPNNPKIRYDPEKASKLLAEAGYSKRNSQGILVNDKTGEPLEFTIGITEGLDRILTPVQQDMLKNGVKLNFENTDPQTKFKNLNERNFRMAWMNWGATLFPNPKSSFRSNLADPLNTNNFAGFKNERADTLIDREQVEYDQQTRIQILRELDSIFMASHQYALAWYAPFQRIVYWNRFGQPDWYIGKVYDWYESGGVLATWWVDTAKNRKMYSALSDNSVTMEVGKTEVTFWPEFRKQQEQGAGPGVSQADTDTDESATGE